VNLPDAPIAHEGFFATHFFTVSDEDKSKDFYVRILGGKVGREGEGLHLPPIPKALNRACPQHMLELIRHGA